MTALYMAVILFQLNGIVIRRSNLLLSVRISMEPLYLPAIDLMFSRPNPCDFLSALLVRKLSEMFLGIKLFITLSMNNPL